MVDRMTAVFPTNLRSLVDNPYWTDTPFGRAIALSVGDVTEELDAEQKRSERLFDAICEAQELLRDGLDQKALAVLAAVEFDNPKEARNG